MTRGGWIVLALALTGATAASAQVSAYAELSASKLTNLDGTRVFYGPTLGMSVQLGAPHHMKLSGDVRASFYGGSNRMDGVAVGPKVSIAMRRFEPYGELLFGFARYNDGLSTRASGTTDGVTQINLGLDHPVSKKVDWRVFEYGYEQFYGLGGQFNPKTFSTGVVYHIGGR